MSEREGKTLSSFLFDGTDVEVLDIKFLPGKDPDLTAERMCTVAKAVLADFFENRTASKLPVGRRAQRGIAEIFETL